MKLFALITAIVLCLVVTHVIAAPPTATTTTASVAADEQIASSAPNDEHNDANGDLKGADTFGLGFYTYMPAPPTYYGYGGAYYAPQFQPATVAIGSGYGDYRRYGYGYGHRWGYGGGHMFHRPTYPVWG